MREAVIQGENEIAVTEDGKLVEYRNFTEAPVRTGDIFWGRIVKCASGNTGSCFVDIGVGRDVFCSERGQAVQGDFLPVMVTSAAHDQKPPRVCCEIRLTGRGLVAVSTPGACFVSHKITEEYERNQLKESGEKLLAQQLGCPGLILRTASREMSFEMLREEAASLGLLYRRISKGLDSPGRLYRPEPCCDFLSRYRELDSIVTDSTAVYERVKPFYPQIRFRGQGDYSLFAVKSISSQLVSLMGRRVWLPGGGNLILEKTEAMTVIDVNSGKASGKKAEPLRVNLEAAWEIMRQLRLRDIGGTIVCDFIRMPKADRTQVLDRLTALADRDFSKPRIHGFTALGLVEISRKRS